MWANPIVWIYVGFVRLNHEYLADEIALKQSTDQAIYKAVLLNQIVGVPVFELSNSFNYSPNKNRFEMMKKVMISPYRKLRVLFFLPVSVFLFYAFSVPEYIYPQIDESFTIYQPSELKSKEVKGVVLMEDGTLLNGVNIIVSGTSAGVITDALGRFTLANVDKKATIALSMEGYKTQMVKPKFSTEMRIVLLKDPDYKKPVYVVTADPSSVLKIRSDFDRLYLNPLLVVDGIISTKKTSDINPSAIASITVLKGKSATTLYGDKANNGAIIITTKKGGVYDLQKRVDTSFTTASSSFRVRNATDSTSFHSLLVIDGVISEKGISDISPDEIKSITVLKDKSGTDKYGDKGKNGVIIISTKKGFPVLQNRADSTKATPAPEIRIKGYGPPFTGIYVVDGVISEDGLSDISPDEVASMKILKDKLATDKYGDKGKNGVIEITTKKSPAGK
jgi:TonB-dependent SusC/RagA subfamily outer membrane receptor